MGAGVSMEEARMFLVECTSSTLPLGIVKVRATRSGQSGK